MHIDLDNHALSRRTKHCDERQRLYSSVQLEFQDAL